MKKYTFYLVGLVVFALSSCDKDKLYYPADFYQGTIQTCINRNNTYLEDYRTFPHIDKNSIFFYNSFPADHLIEYNFITNKLDTLFSPMGSEQSPSYYPSDFYIVSRDSILISTMWYYYWSNEFPNHVYLPYWDINNYIDDTVSYLCLGSLGMYSEMTIVDGKYLVAPVVKTGLKRDTTCLFCSDWRAEYDELKDWNRKHYVRFNCEDNSTVSEVELICSGEWLSSHPKDVYYNTSHGIGNIYSPKEEQFYFFTEHTLEIAVADKEGNYIKSVTPESRFFPKRPIFTKEDKLNNAKMMNYARSITTLSKLYYDEYRNVFLRLMFLPGRDSEDGMVALPKDFVIMVLDEDLDKMYEVGFERKNYTGSIHITEKGVYLLKTDTDESNRYYKADRFIFD